MNIRKDRKDMEIREMKITSKTLQKIKQFLTKNRGAIAICSALMLTSVDANAWIAPTTTVTPAFIIGGTLIFSGIFVVADSEYLVGMLLIVGGVILTSASTIGLI